MAKVSRKAGSGAATDWNIIRKKESDLAVEMVKTAAAGGSVCTYCASCSGSFARKGFDQADHILLKILGSTEKPDTGKSMINRMKTKYWQGGIYGKEEK